MLICKCNKSKRLKIIFILLSCASSVFLIFTQKFVSMKRLYYTNTVSKKAIESFSDIDKWVSSFVLHRKTAILSNARQVKMSGNSRDNDRQFRNSTEIHHKSTRSSTVGDLKKSITMIRTKAILLNGTQLKNETITPGRVYIREELKGRNISESMFNIGILIPSCTRTMETPMLTRLSLINQCLPSIHKFMEEKYNYLIYVGIDKGDYLETMVGNIEAMFDKVKIIVTYGRSFTKTVNTIAREAYKDGMDYLVRINDDTTFETINWTSLGIQTLRRYSPPNVGVVGPTCLQGKTSILTHDMVHRTHLEIFDFYYSPYFDNRWSDDWITSVYQPNRSTKIDTWTVIHHISAQNRRYNVDLRQKLRLKATLLFDKERLAHYISSNVVVTS